MGKTWVGYGHQGNRCEYDVRYDTRANSASRIQRQWQVESSTHYLMIHYKNWGPFIRDAVKQFNDIGILRRIDALNEMTALYKKHQQELSWIGGNLNQVVKRANELAIIGKLTQSYFDDILFPQVREIQELICEIKDEQYHIVKKIMRKT